MERPSLAALAALALLSVAAAPAAPNDPYYHQQWGLQRIGAPQAWSVNRGGGVLVAVLDTGVDVAHPDLVDSIARRGNGSVLGRDLIDDDDDPSDEHGHGTMVAGIIAARTGNGFGVASVAPAARIMPVRVLDANAGGTSEDVDAGIRWAVDNGAAVVNLSLEVAEGQPGGVLSGLQPSASDAAVRYAWQRGAVVVVAAGNDSDEFTDYPEESPILVVGATDQQDRRAAFSDVGRRDAVVAPGVDIVSTWCNPCGARATHTIGMSEGTSYAAPHVSGVLALLRASGLSGSAAVARVRQTAVDIGAPGPDTDTGYGRVDAAAALAVPATTTTTTTPPPRRQPVDQPTRTAAGVPASTPRAHVPAQPSEPPPLSSPEPASERTTETAPASPEALPADTPSTPRLAGAPPVSAPPAPRPSSRLPVTGFAVALLAGNVAALAWTLRRPR